MRTLLLSFLVAFLSFIAIGFTAADEIAIVADPYMPYTGVPESENPGFMIELVKAILQKAGHTVVYKQLAWDEAMSQAKNGDVSAIIGASKEDLPDFIFPETEQACAQGAFYVTSLSIWKFAGIPSLEKICLGVINNYNYSDIQPYIKVNRSNAARIRIFSDTDALPKMVEALIDNKIQVFAEDQNVMHEFLKTFPKADKIIEAGKLRTGTKLYAAFSPKRPDAQDLAKLISDGTVQMRKEGTLKKILDKYQIQDW
jgi:polar amino acid transport system substrate-binding protein